MGSINWKWFLIGAGAGFLLATYGPKYLPMPMGKGKA